MNHEIEQMLAGDGVCYLATCEDGQPHVCPFETVRLLRDRLYFQTRRDMAVSRLLHANPRLALCIVRGDVWLSAEGSAVLDDDRSLLRELPDTAESDELELWYLRNGSTARFAPGQTPTSWKL